MNHFHVSWELVSIFHLPRGFFHSLEFLSSAFQVSDSKGEMDEGVGRRAMSTELVDT